MADRPEDRPLTPAEEERVRRLLADARHTEPTPDDVVARLDSVLAGLAAEAGQAGDQAPVPEPVVAGAPVADLAAARRRRRRLTQVLVAAAAVTVVGVAGPQLLGGAEDVMTASESSGSDAGGASSADDTADGAAPEATPQQDGVGTPEDLVGEEARGSAPAPELTGDSLPSQARRLRGDPATEGDRRQPNDGEGPARLPRRRHLGRRPPGAGDLRGCRRGAGLPSTRRRHPAGRPLRVRREHPHPHPHAPRPLTATCAPWSPDMCLVVARHVPHGHLTCASWRPHLRVAATTRRPGTFAPRPDGSLASGPRARRGNAERLRSVVQAVTWIPPGVFRGQGRAPAATDRRTKECSPHERQRPQRHHHRVRAHRLHGRALHRPRPAEPAGVRGIGDRRRRADEHHRGRELPRLPRRHHGPRPDGRDARPGRAIRRRAGARRRRRGRPHRRRQDRQDGHRHLPGAVGDPRHRLRLPQARPAARGRAVRPRRLVVRDLRRVLLPRPGDRGHRRR